MRLRHIVFAPLLVALGLWLVAPAQAALLITIDKTAQRMTVEQDGLALFEWPVSTGVRGYDTPSGEYKPFRMEKDHFSQEWDDAPMPHSIFFTQQGHAIHGTTHLKAIGTPASHGCVRLEPQNAATLFKLVRQEKMANTRVVLTGEAPAPPPAPPVASAPSNKRAARANPDDDGFTAALPAEPRRAQHPRAPEGAAFFDGRFYYDRRGRRIAEVAPRTSEERNGRWVYGRDYYERAQRGEPPRRYRHDGYFPGWN